MTTVKATAVHSIRANGVRIAPGQVFDCDAADYPNLLRRGAVSEPNKIDMALEALAHPVEPAVKAPKKRKPRAKKGAAALGPEPLL